MLTGHVPGRSAWAGVAALACLALLLATACRSGDTEPLAPVPTVAASPTAGAAAPPATPSRFSGVNGRALYGQACSACHGAALQGTNAGPTFLSRIYAPGHHADISFMFAVERGVQAHHWTFGNMPPVEGLTNEQVLAIIAFIRAQQREAGIE